MPENRSYKLPALCRLQRHCPSAPKLAIFFLLICSDPGRNGAHCRAISCSVGIAPKPMFCPPTPQRRTKTQLQPLPYPLSLEVVSFPCTWYCKTALSLRELSVILYSSGFCLHPLSMGPNPQGNEFSGKTSISCKAH